MILRNRPHKVTFSTEAVTPAKSQWKPWKVVSTPDPQGLAEADADYFWRAILSPLISEGLRLLNEAYKADRVLTKKQLRNALIAYVPTACDLIGAGRPVHPYEVATGAVSKGWLSTGQAEARARLAAKRALKYWTPAVIDSARAGGSAKSYTLDDYLRVRHLTNKSEMARVLGVSRPTVYAMLREFEGVNLETGEVTDEWYQASDGEAAEVWEGAGVPAGPSSDRLGGVHPGGGQAAYLDLGGATGSRGIPDSRDEHRALTYGLVA